MHFLNQNMVVECRIQGIQMGARRVSTYRWSQKEINSYHMKQRTSGFNSWEMLRVRTVNFVFRPLMSFSNAQQRRLACSFVSPLLRRQNCAFRLTVHENGETLLVEVNLENENSFSGVVEYLKKVFVNCTYLLRPRKWTLGYVLNWNN